jgi:hypothetical protein
MNNLNEKWYIVLKRRLDRGRIYAGYYSTLGITILLLDRFNLNEWYWFVVAIPSTFIVFWLVGYIEEKTKIIDNEQKGYALKNPVSVEMLNKLREIHKLLLKK